MDHGDGAAASNRWLSFSLGEGMGALRAVTGWVSCGCCRWRSRSPAWRQPTDWSRRRIATASRQPTAAERRASRWRALRPNRHRRCPSPGERRAPTHARRNDASGLVGRSLYSPARGARQRRGSYANRGSLLMCQRVECPKCHRPTYAGCGMHIEQVLGDVPPAQRCRCREEPAREQAKDSAISVVGGPRAWLRGLLGK